MKIKLSEKCARTDFTDREISKIISGLCFVLSEMSDIDTVRRAIRWVAETEEFWEYLKKFRGMSQDINPADFV